MVDVVVVGGGPTGLLLAGELKLAGAEPLVLEASGGSARRSRSFHIRGINLRSMQTLALRGLDAPLIAEQRAMFDWIATHGGSESTNLLRRMLDEGRAQGVFSLLPLQTEPSDDRWVILQPHRLERILVDWVTSLGVTVRPGSEVVEVVDEGPTVVAILADGESVRAPYLVGCDGGRSVVRKTMAIDFVGTEATMTGRVAAVTVADPMALRSNVRSPGGLLLLSMIPGEISTIEFSGGPADPRAPLTASEMQDSIRRVSGVPDVEVTTFDGGIRFSDNTRQAVTYRRGRVFLAGDAAHVHSAIGGQGLNLGLQDAANLGWKLGLVARGLADEELLDTYHAERHPIGARVLRNTRAQVALMRPGPQVDALREVVSEVIAIPDAQRYFIDMANGFDIDYAGTGEPYVGKFMPEVLPLTNGGGLLIGATAAGYEDRLRCVAGRTPMLVRPDGYVAWASTGDDARGLDESLRHWFGVPGPVTVDRVSN
ncbi:FAD-dependent monooxygenase [Nocardia sp. CDC160]|uniref:FAD-dependent monooxygenase n=1 Tax=Nocardia sp. CDC160 TaxID=3112166 RepID=UPI002DB610CC|nr:FAD-dependent monooxygenase [Nocardia sp. CDC160]MEC3919281.1 FAD-dependent monooxygenase [Nocardia sp. CDC160]